MGDGRWTNPVQSFDCSVVIVNWNGRDLLAECLRSLLADAPDESPALDVWVIDNGSDDGSAEMVRAQFPMVHLIANRENLGFAAATNQGIERARGRYVLLLNTDAFITPAQVQTLTAFMDAHDDAGVVGPTLLNADGSFQASHGRFPTLASCLAELTGTARRIYGPYYPSAGPDSAQGPRAVEWVGGACLLARVQAIETVGALDVGFFMYAEEMDWCYRMRESGWKVYHDPNVAVVHLGGASSHVTRPWMLARQWKSRLRFMRKHDGRFKAGIVRVWVAGFGLLGAAAYSALGVLMPASRKQMHAKAIAYLNLSLLRIH